MAAAFRRSGVEAVSLSTDEDLVRAIVRMATLRRQRRPGHGRSADVVHLAGRPALAPPHPARARALRRPRAATPPARPPRPASGHRHPARRRRGADAPGGCCRPPCPSSGSPSWRSPSPGRRGRSTCRTRKGTVDPRLRRLGQHGRHRPPADPDGRGQGGRQGLRRAAALERRDRRRRVQRLGPVRPGPDERPGDGPRGDRPADPAARDVARTGDPGVARPPSRPRRPARRPTTTATSRLRRPRPRHRSRRAITHRR